MPDDETMPGYSSCTTCGDDVYLTVSGVWRHTWHDPAHNATPKTRDSEGTR